MCKDLKSNPAGLYQRRPSQTPTGVFVSEQEALKVPSSKPAQTCLCVLNKVKQEAAPEPCSIQTIAPYQRQTHVHIGVCLALRLCVHVWGWNDCVQIKTFLLAQRWEITFTLPQPPAEPSPDHQRPEHALPRSQHCFPSHFHYPSCLSLSNWLYTSCNYIIKFKNLVSYLSDHRLCRPHLCWNKTSLVAHFKCYKWAKTHIKHTDSTHKWLQHMRLSHWVLMLKIQICQNINK